MTPTRSSASSAPSVLSPRRQPGSCPMDLHTLFSELALARRLAHANLETGDRQAHEEAQALALSLDRQLTERLKVEVPF
jgi:hypothetical protein